jgi:hypothetical protein
LARLCVAFGIDVEAEMVSILPAEDEPSKIATKREVRNANAAEDAR